MDKLNLNKVRDFVAVQVIYCCSTLIQELGENTIALSNERYEQLMQLLVKNTYTHNYHSYYCDEETKELFRVSCDRPGEEIIHELVYHADENIEVSEFDDVREAVLQEYFKTINVDYMTTPWVFLEEDEEPEFEEEEEEVYEHWIVTDWLANRLIEKGEVVVKDFMGLDIYARTTMGQPLYMDSVMQEIYTDLQKSL